MSTDPEVVTVAFRTHDGEADSREYSKEVHGPEYKNLAAEFSQKMAAQRRLISGVAAEAPSDNGDATLGSAAGNGKPAKAPAKKAAAKKAAAKKTA